MQHVMLAKRYKKGSQDLSGWLWFEQPDGARVWYDPLKMQLVTKTGAVLNGVPGDIMEELGRLGRFLDGHLAPDGSVLRVLDIVDLLTPYARRKEIIQNAVAHHQCRRVVVVPHHPMGALDMEKPRTVMLVDPGAMYEFGPSSRLLYANTAELKVK